MAKSEYVLRIEEQYGATHIAYMEVNGRDMDVFYQPNPKTELGHSNYFGILMQGSSLMITQARRVQDETYPAIIIDNTLMTTLRNHDFQMHASGAMLDGGPGYGRINPDFAPDGVLRVVGDKLAFVGRVKPDPK
jgi:hypothetical protein